MAAVLSAEQGLLKIADAAAARVADPKVRFSQALLLPAAGDGPATLAVSPGTCTPDRLLDINHGSPRQVRIDAMIDSGSDFERAA